MVVRTPRHATSRRTTRHHSTRLDLNRLDQTRGAERAAVPRVGESVSQRQALAGEGLGVRLEPGRGAVEM